MMKIRPLGAFSDFVVEKLPSVLELPSNNLAKHCANLASQVSEETIQTMARRGEITLAALDAKMVEIGFTQCGLAVPEVVSSWVERFSEDKLPMLLYEEIILGNPAEDPRVFTQGSTGETEQMFYRTHRKIENHLDSANTKVQNAISAAMYRRCGGDEIARHLANVETDLQAVIQKTCALRGMDKAHFAAFRKYLGAHPARGLKGPSGAFSPGIHLLEILLRGDDMPESYLRYLWDNSGYFPQNGYAAITDALQAASACGSLASIARALDCAKLSERVNVIGQFFNDFRRIHFGVVNRQLPEATQDKIAGTAGEARPGTFMRERIEKLRFTKLRGQ